MLARRGPMRDSNPRRTTAAFSGRWRPILRPQGVTRDRIHAQVRGITWTGRAGPAASPVSLRRGRAISRRGALAGLSASAERTEWVHAIVLLAAQVAEAPRPAQRAKLQTSSEALRREVVRFGAVEEVAARPSQDRRPLGH